MALLSGHAAVDGYTVKRQRKPSETSVKSSPSVATSELQVPCGAAAVGRDYLMFLQGRLHVSLKPDKPLGRDAEMDCIASVIGALHFLMVSFSHSLCVVSV